VNSFKYKTAFVLHFALLLVAICFGAVAAYAQDKVAVKDLTSELGNKYYDAVDFLLKNPWMTDTIILEKLQPDIALSAVIPAMIRYSALRDIVEASAMRTLYIRSGRKYAHYSVGRFQMKPSFAELVERTYTRQKLGPYKFVISNTPKARSERARRLESMEWQLRYLVMFNKIMDKRYAHIKWKNDEDKARFYATAFDVGFNRDERTIRRMMTPRKINIRTKKVDSKYRTGDVAVWFMVNDGHRFRGGEGSSEN
jgi:hypothetical protein